MISINMSEKALIFNYILLTTQVALALEDLSENKQLTEQQRKTLQKGAILLSKIIEGATLVEGKGFKNGLTPTVEGLSVLMDGYTHST